MYTNLKKEMQARGVTKQDLADELGVHINSINNKLNHNKKFYVDQAIKIHEKYFKDIEMAELFKQ